MNIGRAAARSGVSAKMIRYYEANGLIARPLRTDAGYRVYSERDVNDLGFIRRARDLGFSVEQIRELLGLWRDEGRASVDVKRIALEHVALLQRKAHELAAMAADLERLARSCSGDETPNCPIILGLAGGAAPQPTASRSPRQFGILDIGCEQRRMSAQSA